MLPLILLNLVQDFLVVPLPVKWLLAFLLEGLYREYGYNQVVVLILSLKRSLLYCYLVFN